MNKRLRRIGMALVGMAMAVGVGITVANNKGAIATYAANGDAPAGAITTVAGITSGRTYLIGATVTSNATSYYFKASGGIAVSASNLSGVTDTSASNATMVTFTKKDGEEKWYLQFTNGNYMHLPASNGKYLVSASAQEWTLSDQTNFLRLSNNSRSLQRNNTAGTSVFGSYGNTQRDVFLENTYEATFNSDGGSTSPSKQILIKNATFTFPSPGTKSGYNFLGWSSDGGTTKYNAGDKSPAITVDTAYTAYWEANVNPAVILDKDSLDLTINGESDSGAIAASTENITNPSYSWEKVSGDDCVTLTNTDKATVNVASKGTAVSASATLRLTVTGRNKTDTAAIDPITKDITVNVSKVSSIEHPFTVAEANAIISGLSSGTNSPYLYLGGTISQVDSISSGKITYWISDDGTKTDQMKVYQGKNLNDTAFSAVTDLYVGDEVVIYGTLSQTYKNVNSGNYLASISKLQYTVSFDGNGGDGSMADSSEDRGAYALPANGFTAPSKKEFAGWKIKIGDETQATLRAVGYSHTLTSDITLVAQWNDLVTLSYDANGGSGNIESVNYGSGATATVATNTFTAPAGKIFNGWYTTSTGTGGTAYIEGQTFTITADVKLYAQWANKVTLSYNANGGSGAPESVDYASGATATAASGSSMTAPDSTFGFVKWNTKADGTGTDRVAEATFTISGDVTLYAIWSKLPLTIGTNGYSDSAEQTALNWSSIGTGGNLLSEIYFGGVHYEVTGTGNNGKVYGGPTWRFYQNGGSSSALGISVVSNDDALRIKSIKVTFTVSDSGTLNYGSTKLTSGTALDLTSYDLNSVSLKVGATSGTNGKVSITKIDTVIGFKSAFEAAQSFENAYVKRDIDYPDPASPGVDGTDCLSAEKGGKGYYNAAKDAYETLSSDAKIWFATRSEFANARARIIAWAVANGDTIEFNTTTGAIQPKTSVNNWSFVSNALGNSSSIIIGIITSISLVTLGGYIALRRRKED